MLEYYFSYQADDALDDYFKIEGEGFVNKILPKNTVTTLRQMLNNQRADFPIVTMRRFRDHNGQRTLKNIILDYSKA